MTTDSAITITITIFNESIEDEACSHYKFVVYLTILISFTVLVYTDDVTINSSRGWPLVILYAALIAEGIFYSPLATVRKRGAQHLLMCKSGSTIFTWLSPLCYSVICVHIVIMGVVGSLWF